MTVDDESFPVFDDDFVRGAVRKEASAADRISTAQRVAADHSRTHPWRTSASTASRPRRTGRRRVPVLLLTVAVVGGLVYLNPGAVGLTTDQVVDTQPHPPRPQDAARHPLGQPVTPPAGTGGYALLTKSPKTQDVIRFNPCRPIHYVIRHDLEPTDGADVITRAFAEVSHDTGLRFINDGSTSEAPRDKRPLVIKEKYGNRWSPVLVAWSTVRESPELKGDVDGYAGPQIADDDGLHLVSGQVVLDAQQLTGPSGAAQPAAYVTMLHELAHVMGLAHASDPRELMYPRLSTQTRFGPGDLRGLAFVGTGPCTFAG
jgi:hypothetical protein